MIPGMVDQRMPFGSHAFDQVWILLGPRTSHPERRVDTVCGERIQDLRRITAVGSGSKREGDRALGRWKRGNDLAIGGTGRTLSPEHSQYEGERHQRSRCNTNRAKLLS